MGEHCFHRNYQCGKSWVYMGNDVIMRNPMMGNMMNPMMGNMMNPMMGKDESHDEYYDESNDGYESNDGHQ